MLWKISFLLCADFTEGHSKTGVEILEKRADILRETCARDFHISPQKGRFKGHHDILVSFQATDFSPVNEGFYKDQNQLFRTRKAQPERGLRICVPWKCASQYVKHIHGVVISQSEEQRRLTGDKGEENLKSSTVLIARHPFVRLISSWNDKFLRVNIQSAPMMKRSNIDRFVTYEHETHRISFEDFVNYLVYAAENKEKINHHFAPQHIMCPPCVSDFDKILKVEHLKDEMVALFRNHDLHVPELEETYHEQTGGFGAAEKDKLITKVRARLKTIPTETIWKLYKFYKKDFDILNYSFDMNMLKIGGF
ncbi:unnamed protein product [Oikopleura dioica]|uniref:Carbohydrate sulfotransferase n=1 Tax=Oikopleura dioica TaxID=34765 RepID=E4XNE0_OIKDI|nr:unnamed protein product [Oikopleura dioica]